MREAFLPVALPLIEAEEIEEILATLKSGWITTGPLTNTFEDAFKKYVGTEHAIAVSSCTAALHLSLLASAVEAGNEVITTPYTFVSTINTILHCGAIPVFVDIDRQSYNIDWRQIEPKITPRTKAIVPVHFAGQPCEIDEILQIAGRHGLQVIEDAAHATGAAHRQRKIGSRGNPACFSFYAIKNMTTGEGGMVATNDAPLAEKIRLFSLHGMNRDAWKRYTSPGAWYYEILYPGFKYNMTDLQAALGIHQLAKLDRFIGRRSEIAGAYTRAFRRCPSLIVPNVESTNHHAWHLYPLLIRPERLTVNRNAFIEKLRARKIGTSVHFIPNHLQPYYRERFGFKEGDFPASEWVYEREISLPLYPKMSPGDAEDVIEAVLQICETHQK